MTAQRPAEAPRRLPRDTGLPGLYAGALRHLAGRTAHFLGRRLYCFALCPCSAAEDAPDSPRARSMRSHPSAQPTGDTR